MKTPKIIEQIDRWGTILLIYLIPWQARLIFSQGYLAGVPSEPQTRSLFAVEVLIAAMVIIRFSAIAIEKERVARNLFSRSSRMGRRWSLLARSRRSRSFRSLSPMTKRSRLFFRSALLKVWRSSFWS